MGGWRICAAAWHSSQLALLMCLQAGSLQPDGPQIRWFVYLFFGEFSPESKETDCE